MYDKVAMCVCAASSRVPRSANWEPQLVWYENGMSKFNYRGNDLTKLKTVENIWYMNERNYKFI